MSGRGGARANAGRPPELDGGRTVAVYLDVQTLDKIDRVCVGLGLTRSQAIRLLIMAANIDRENTLGKGEI
jgi:hypothetical protein